LVINYGTICNAEAGAEEKKDLPREKKQNPAFFRVIACRNALNCSFLPRLLVSGMERLVTAKQILKKKDLLRQKGRRVFDIFFR